MPSKKPFSYNKNNNIPPYVTGELGDLIVTNGQTVTLTGGQTYQYDNIDIQAGGTVNVSNASLNMTQILARKSFNIDGTLNCRSYESNSYSRSGNYVSGIAYSKSISQRAGGTGGRGTSESDSEQPAGGAGTNGYGGGGSGGASFNEQYGWGGSNNGNGNSRPDGGGQGGLGNYTQGHGHTGDSGAGSARGGEGGGSGGGGGHQQYDKGGGGGGGGNKGRHGKLLYLMCSFEITGSGFVNLSGENGYSGGRGGAEGGGESGGGGGGGGGAGGSGGHLFVQAPGFNPAYSIGGGAGGGGGLLGPNSGSSGGEFEGNGNGGGGQSGLSGSFTLESDTFRSS